jgi:hypothetical protein
MGHSGKSSEIIYAHTANVYHALYRIGKRYGLTSRATPQEYLEFSSGSLTLAMADSTSLSPGARVVITGLAPGKYGVSYGSQKTTQSVKDSLILEWSLKDSARAVITRY